MRKCWSRPHIRRMHLKEHAREPSREIMMNESDPFHECGRTKIPDHSKRRPNCLERIRWITVVEVRNCIATRERPYGERWHHTAGNVILRMGIEQRINH